MLLRLVPYVLILVLAAGLALGGYYAGLREGEAKAIAAQLEADFKQASADAEKRVEWEDFNAKLAQETAKVEDENAVTQRKIDAAIRLESSGVACGGPEWLRSLESLK